MEDDVEVPGFRFHPTEEEILNFYLKTTVLGKKLRVDIIGILNIYNHHPVELPGLAKIGDREWYFFVPRDRKHGRGGKPNRTTQNGFWKATGSDRKILSNSHPKKMLGYKKTLVFYEGRAPQGRKTDWIMNGHHLPENDTCFHSPPKDIVLCKIYMKANPLKVLELRAAVEEPHASTSFCNQLELFIATMSESMGFKKENEEDTTTLIAIEEETYCEACNTNSEGRDCTNLVLPNGKENLPDLQVPKLNMDWTRDTFWTQFRSPWLDNYTPFLPMC